MKKNKIIIYGDGGHATSCIDLIESTNLFKIIGIVSNKSFKTFNSYPIIGTDRELSNLKKIWFGSDINLCGSTLHKL